MTKRTLATGILALALLATPRVASAGVHFSFGIGLPFFGAVVAPAPAVVVPAPGYVLPPAYYPYPYPPVVAYGPPGYYGGSVVVCLGRHPKPAIDRHLKTGQRGAGRRDVDLGGGLHACRRDGQRLERRETTAGDRAGPAGVVAPAH